MTTRYLFTDGGVIKKNPSPLGGTWAWCIVEGAVFDEQHQIFLSDGKKVFSESGYVVPDQWGLGETVSNNDTELIAMLKGIRALGDQLLGVKIFTDSQVTINRLHKPTKKWKLTARDMDGKRKMIAAPLRNVWDDILKTHPGFLEFVDFHLLDGHPTKKQIQTGRGKRGNPVSVWNVWCDHACGKAKEAILGDKNGSTI